MNGNMQRKEHDNPCLDLTFDIPANDFYNNNSECIHQENDDATNNRTCCDIVSESCRNKAANIFRKKILYKRLPILTWLPKYNTNDFIGDLVAGITVGLTVIPQGLAYASIAGLDLQYGLYSCFLGCFVYIFLGSSKDVPVGPTAISALMVAQMCYGNWQKAVLLTFLTGIIEVCMGIFRFGFLIDFVSGPVSAGFTSAVSLIIVTSQLKDLIGVNAKGDSFVNMWISIVNDIHNISWNDAAFGLGCITLLLTMRVMTNTTFGPKEGKKPWQKLLTNIFWFIGTSRNALLVCAATAFGCFMHNQNMHLFRIVGEVPAGLPSFQLPSFSLDTVVNGTNGEIVIVHESFFDLVSGLGSGLIVVPLISLLENMAVIQAFAQGKQCDATQELIAVGTCNIVTSFVQGFRSNGGLARAAVLNASGVCTQLSNLYTGIIVVVALMYLTPAFFFIPKATLAAIIMAAVIFMVQYRVIKPMWRSKKTDLIPGLGAFIACLVLPLQVGILVGIGINVLFILYHAARPKLRVATMMTTHGINYLMLTPDRCLIFPSVEFVRNVINKQGRKSTLPVVIDCTHIYGADFTAAKVVSTMIGDFQARNQKIYFFNLQPRVLEVFEGMNKNLHAIYDVDALERELATEDNEITKV